MPTCDYCGDESRVLLRATIGSGEWPHVCPECAKECTRCGAIGVADEDFKTSDSRGYCRECAYREDGPSDRDLYANASNY
jgi:hypothetical protein